MLSADLLRLPPDGAISKRQILPLTGMRFFLALWVVIFHQSGATGLSRAKSLRQVRRVTIERVLLTLLQLADSALPIGAASHSFGTETLVAEGSVTVEELPEFLSAYIEECLLCEAVFLHHAWRLSDTFSRDDWDRLGHELSARRPAREPRSGGIALGRRFLRLAHSLHPRQVFEDALQFDELHHCNAFGLVCGALEIPSDWASLAYLQQAITGMVSACQRLMPLGQSAAGLLVRNLQVEIRSAATRSATLRLADIQSFAPSFELAGMRHPRLATRLFIS